MSRCLLGQLLADGRRNSAHVDDDQSFSRPFEYTVWPGHAFDDLAFVIVYLSHFAFIGRYDRMLHFHGAKDNEYLPVLHCFAIAYLYFDDGSRHRCCERFLSVGDAHTVRGCIYVWWLTSFEVV